MFRMPDNPNPVSLDFLRELDAEEPGRWIAQPKLDGWRRTAWREPGGRWTYGAKHTKGPAARDMPRELVAEFELFPWPREVLGLDMEWVGPRHKGSPDTLHVFDLLSHTTLRKAGWLGDTAFVCRYTILREHYEAIEATMKRPDLCKLRLVPIQRNPGLMDFYSQQLQDPYSEGLVIRRADSGLIGGLSRCADNPHWYKIRHRGIKE